MSLWYMLNYSCYFFGRENGKIYQVLMLKSTEFNEKLFKVRNFFEFEKFEFQKSVKFYFKKMPHKLTPKSLIKNHHFLIFRHAWKNRDRRWKKNVLILSSIEQPSRVSFNKWAYSFFYTRVDLFLNEKKKKSNDKPWVSEEDIAIKGSTRKSSK